MTSHRAETRTGPVVVGLLICLAILMVLVAVSLTSTNTTPPAQTTTTATATITATNAPLDYEAPSVGVVEPPELDGSPIPTCARNEVGPGTPPCHWDSGQFGGSESYIWTGKRKIPLVEPQP